MTSLSFNIIARNGANDLKNLIPQLKSVADEIIVVVDDRTTDDTFNVCKELGAKPYMYKWTEGFKGARNFAISKSSCQYIAWVDCDDRVEDFKVLEEFKRKNNNFKTIYTFNVRNMPQTVLFAQVRMFPNHPLVKFIYRVHETIDSSVVGKGFKIQPMDLVVQHWGYSDKSKLKDKLHRNLPEIEAEVKSGSFCPSLKYTFAMNLKALGKDDQADYWLHNNIDNKVKNSPFRDVYLFSVLALAKSLVDKKQYTLAEHYLAMGLFTLPDFKEYHALKIKIYYDNFDFRNAATFYRLARQSPIRNYAVAVDNDATNKVLDYYGRKLGLI